MSSGSAFCLLLALLPDDEIERRSLLRILEVAIPGVSTVETGAGKRLLDTLRDSDPVSREVLAQYAAALPDEGAAVRVLFPGSVLTVVLSVMLQRGCHDFLLLKRYSL